ncbi:intradiol ring-cleavage dioxygenase [Hydrogenophaga sp. RWCD_12]|uniref:dioxygenase family protein n=1 Tax=Hydrogenophaga sp. RWCD_12 TaxID=3391190 RepID=UPI0039849281
MHEHGLRHDMNVLMQQTLDRRRGLRWLGGAALGAVAPLSLLACGGGSDDDGSTASTDGGSCSVIPTETAGPYPADGSVASGQRQNALTLSGIVRSDIRSSIGNASGTALGVPLTVVLTLVNAGSACEALAGRAVYLWHCTRDGGYSMYSGGHTQENYLRGIQVSDSNGQVTFTTIFPGCYSGRWPHIHFEVYQSLDIATDDSVVSDHGKVSQLALPAIACDQIYGVAAGYSASVANYANISLASDGVFGNDSAAHQVATMTGSVDAGYTARLTVGLAI